MISVNTALDPLTGIPTVSLYGDSFESLAPTVDQLADLDVVVIDLQDVGARYYTYVYTAMMTAEAASAAGVDVLVLDRPNPIAAAIEGPDIQDGFESFVGMLPLPNRHGLTLAEVLRYASNRGRGGHVQVISAEGWQRDAYFDEHDAPWVMPSPNMPTLDTAIVYPGMCLLEGTNASEGRGWTRPFEVFGAPYVDAYLLAETLRGLELPGVLYRPLSTRVRPQYLQFVRDWGGHRLGDGFALRRVWVARRSVRVRRGHPCDRPALWLGRAPRGD
jgi:uncharacterized protein YbbC (DUF1343 family)